MSCSSSSLKLMNSDVESKSLYKNSNVLYIPTKPNSKVYIEYFLLNSFISMMKLSLFFCKFILKIKYAHNVNVNVSDRTDCEYNSLCIGNSYFFSDGKKITIEASNLGYAMLNESESTDKDLELINQFVYRTI